jgi:hypothetical protein
MVSDDGCSVHLESRLTVLVSLSLLLHLGAGGRSQPSTELDDVVAKKDGMMPCATVFSSARMPVA